MEAAFIAMGWALLSASALLIGAYTAMYWDPGPVTLSVMMAFGGGALVEALSIELFGHVRMLQRQGEPYVMWVAIVAAALGGLLYYGLEQLLNNRGAFLRSKFYLTSTIQNVLSVRNEFGTSYWEVETDRGQREFVVQNVAENAQWLGDHRLLIIDVDGNRFEIPRLDELDKKSLGMVEQVL